MRIASGGTFSSIKAEFAKQWEASKLRFSPSTLQNIEGRQTKIVSKKKKNWETGSHLAKIAEKCTTPTFGFY